MIPVFLRDRQTVKKLDKKKELQKQNFLSIKTGNYLEILNRLDPFKTTVLAQFWHGSDSNARSTICIFLIMAMKSGPLRLAGDPFR